MKDIPDNYYDAIIIQTVIHHLAGNTPRESEQNVLEALRNCKRILKKMVKYWWLSQLLNLGLM